jgi:hypothetical protein
MAGESVGAIPVNSSEKLLTSSSSLMRGTKGAVTFFLATSSQFKVCRKGKPPETRLTSVHLLFTRLHKTLLYYREEWMLFEFLAVQDAASQTSSWVLDEQAIDEIFDFT